MTEIMEYRGPDDAGFVSGGGASIGAPPALDHRRRGRPPALRQRARPHLGRPERRDLQPRRPARRSCARAATCCAAAATPRSSPTSTRSTAPALAERLRGMFAVSVWDQDARRGVLIRDRMGIKPLYYAIVQDRVVFGSELKVRPGQRARERRARPRGDLRLPDARLHPGRHDAAQGRPQAAAGRAPGRRGRPRPARALVGVPGAGLRRRHAHGRRVGRDRARQARRVGEDAADERRAARRDAQRRPRLEPDRRADGAPHDRAARDLRGRLRRRGLRDPRRAPRGRGPGRQPPRARGRAAE